MTMNAWNKKKVVCTLGVAVLAAVALLSFASSTWSAPPPPSPIQWDVPLIDPRTGKNTTQYFNAEIGASILMLVTPVVTPGTGLVSAVAVKNKQGMLTGYELTCQKKGTCTVDVFITWKIVLGGRVFFDTVDIIFDCTVK